MSARRYGRGLRVRSALLFAALAAALLLVAALLGRFTFERMERAERDEAAARLDRVLRAEWDRQARAVEAAVARAVEGLSRDPAALDALLRGRPAARDLAARRAAEAGLDALLLVRPAEEPGAPGTVLSAHPWPERLGTPPAADLPDASAPPTLHRRAAEAGGGLDVRRVDAARPGGVPLLVVGSLRFAPAGLAGLGETDLRLTAHLPDALAPVAVPLPGTTPGEEAGGDREIRAALDVGSGATLVAVAGRDPARAAERRRLFRDGLLLAALLALPLAAWLGWWSAARASAPVAHLVESVDAIAAGEADYAFARGPGDEFEELASAFSRLQRSLEEQRARSRAAERVAAWKEIARRVAHEVKNPLAPIRLTVQNLLRARERAPERFDALLASGASTILEEVDRLDRLVGEFSSFARLPAPKPEPLDARAVLDEVARLFAAEPDVALDVQADAGTALEADRDQLVRALSNLVKNGIEAMREAGAPAPRAVDLRARSVDGGEGRGEGETVVRLSVRDRGPGFGAEGRARAGEPYWTTKESGTGLGLAIARRIAEEHGATLEIGDAADGPGAEVALRWPAAPAAPRPPDGD